MTHPQNNRLASGGRIERNKPLSFHFNGRRLQGYQGDSIASALLANGISTVNRSIKYHRPRGILSACGQDANTIVQVGDDPNVLADRRRVTPGSAVRAVNVFGGLDKDRGALIGRFARFLPVGFYYKAFYKPRGAFKYWERVIRAMAGLGKVNLDAHHGYYDKMYGFCDVAVIGGGPAGMAAALLTTLYGAMLANIVFLPMADKLGLRSSEEALAKTIVIHGVMSIQSGDNPRTVESKLTTFLPPRQRPEPQDEAA